MLNKYIKHFSLNLLLVFLAGLQTACKPAVQTNIPTADSQKSPTTVPVKVSEPCSSTGIELLLCKSKTLEKLADLRATLKLKAESSYPASELELLRLEQTTWAAVNTACLHSSKPSDCVETNYRQSISALQISTGSSEISESANYLCGEDSHDYLTVVFYNQTELPAIVLTRVSDRIDSQKVAFHVPSGSGAKYQGKDILFWTKAAEAQVDWGKEPLNCLLQPANSGGI